MNQTLNQILVVFGVIFLVLLIILGIFFIADPYNIKPLIFGSIPKTITVQKEENPKEELSEVDNSTTTTETNNGGGFTLSTEQKQALVSFGIDPATVPSTISAEQEACFTAVLGASRVEQIKAGAVPSAVEFFKAKSCI
jgi:hypothetical protein